MRWEEIAFLQRQTDGQTDRGRSREIKHIKKSYNLLSLTCLSKDWVEGQETAKMSWYLDHLSTTLLTKSQQQAAVVVLETERKRVTERLKRSVVSSAPSALRRGVTSETGD